MPDHIVDIAVPVSVHQTFHYRVPDDLQQAVLPGSRVLVPLGSRRVVGTVVGFPERSGQSRLKDIIEVLDDRISPELLKLARWMADYYLHPLGLTIETMVPRAVSRARPKKRKYLRLISGVPSGPVRGKKQAALREFLASQPEVALDTLSGFSPATIRSLVQAGIAEMIEREEEPDTAPPAFTPDAALTPMPEQDEAVRGIAEALAVGGFQAFLLNGITGSGKTEVYLQCISRLAGSGKGAIVLVPEIALTPQLLERFRRRFGSRVAVLHSGLTDRERADEYRRIQSGRVDVAIGARSAVFAPFPHLGLVIVDEEHENSYKQEEGLRYHARDVAVVRAKFENTVAVLGSATPSLESYANAQTGKYRLLSLKHRVDHRPLPVVQVIDTRTLPKQGLYAPVLINGIKRRLAQKEQTLLLLNRRGFSSVLICRDCGAAVKCPSCSVSLTYHKAEQHLKCHYCDFTTRPPDRCPSCSSLDLKMIGAGTQKIEEELKALMPEARIVRMDSDTARARGAYDAMHLRMDRGEVDILLGTQMVAKGHDFPSVTLVGVIDADVGLNLPDFRAAEKTFQLITQAAGRAGRGELAGEVIIQTMNPGHYSLRHSMTHDYEGFSREEMRYRSALGYPPVGRMVKLEFRSVREETALEASKSARNRIRSRIAGNDPVVLGPAPAPVARVRGKHRFQILLISQKRDLLRSLAAAGKAAAEEKHGRTCQVIIDVDPVNLM